MENQKVFHKLKAQPAVSSSSRKNNNNKRYDADMVFLTCH